MSLIILRNFKRAKAQDAAELRVVHAKGVGKWWVEPNLSRFNDADREQTHKGRKEFPDREAAMKYARGTGKTFIVNDACEDSAEFHVGQRVRAKDPAYEYSDGKSLGAGMFTVKEVRNNGDVKLDDYGDVWISPSALVEANDSCGKGE